MAKILTQRAVEAAKPKADRFGKPDGLVPGQQLVVHPGGKKSYRLLARINGGQVNFPIGDATVLSLAQARTEGKRILAEIALGKDPRETKQEAVRTASETVEIVARRFIERHAKANNKTWREVQRKLEVNVLPHWGKRPIASITQRDVIALLDSIVDRGAAVEANRILATVRKLFNWACERGTIETSPCARVKAPTPERARDRVLDDREISLIWRAANALGYPFGPFVQLLILTGQRREEVAGMKWSELDRDLVNWVLPRERVKNNEPHQIPIVPWARSILADLPRIENSDFVFTTTGSTSISGYSRAKTSLDAAIATLNGGEPIASWTFHDLRRTMASRMAKLGVQLPTVEKLLNHISGTFGGVQGIYQRHDFADEKRAALEVWAQHLLTLDLVERGPVAVARPLQSRVMA